jgi:hypothetical protein
MAIPPSVTRGVPDFESLSFEGAVRLFKQWGFQVEPGPRSEEVTLILEEPGYRVVSVHDARVLPEMAAAALRVRWQNGADLSARRTSRNPTRYRFRTGRDGPVMIGGKTAGSEVQIV